MNFLLILGIVRTYEKTQEPGKSYKCGSRGRGTVGGIRWSTSWPWCSSPWNRPLSLWRVGAHNPGTQGQSDNRVTTVYPPRQRGHNSLPDDAYLPTTRWTGAWGYRGNRPYFSTPPGDRTRDLSVVSRVCYRCTTEASRYNEVHEHFLRPAPVDVNTAILTTKHLKITNCVGSDGMSLRHIRDSLPVIIHYQTSIINTSIVTRIFSSARKRYNHSHLKSGDHNNVNNYCVRSLLPILSKVLEKVVAQ